MRGVHLIIAKYKNKCVSGNGSEISARVVTHIFLNYYFFLEKNIMLCILKGISPFKMHKIIFFSRKPEKKFKVSPVNLGRVGLP